MKLNTYKVLLPLAMSVILPGSYAMAAEEDKDSNVVVVTAQKRVERLSEVPISMSVFPAESIEQTGIQELRELAEFIPNVVITQGTDFNSRILIRGVGAPSRNIGFDSRVGVYLDGVYLGQGPAINQDLVELERIEVLRGPQGTLFGKNTVAGAISLISKKPNQDLEGSFSVNVSNFSGLELRGNINIPLDDTLAAKFSYSSRERDGYIDNVWDPSHVPTNLLVGFNPTTGAPIFVPISAYIQGFVDPQVWNPLFAAFGLPPHPTNGLGPTTAPDNIDLNNQDTQSWRAQFKWDASDDLEINLAIDGLSSERRPVLGVNLTDTFGAFKEINAPGLDQVSWSTPGNETRDIFGISLDMTYEFDNGYTVRSISANRKTEITYGNDTDYGAVDWVSLEYSDEYDQTTQELQLISPDNEDFKYVLGLYLYKQNSETFRDVFNGNGAFFFTDFVPPTAFIPNFLPSINYPGSVTRNNGDLETTSTAFFISGSYQLDEQWKLGFGVRYTQEDKEVLWYLDGRFSGAFGIYTTAPGGYANKRSDSNTSPTVSLNYAVSDDANLYVKYATGFKSGGFNLDYIDSTAFAAGITFEKETVDSFEVGLKTTLMDGRLTLNMAAFTADFEDYQVNQFFSLGITNGVETTSIRIRNAAEVETSGFEIEGIFRINDDLTINGSFGSLDATFSSFPDGASPRDPVTGVKLPVSDADGNRLPGAADMSASLGIQYYSRIESMDADLLIRLDITHTGDYFTTIENVKSRGLNGMGPLTAALDLAQYGKIDSVPFGFVDAYTLLNGRIGIIDGNGAWEVYLWGRNLTDEDQYVDTFREFFGTLVVTPQTPRTFGLEVSYHF